jgi:hypothetical protein
MAMFYEIQKLRGAPIEDVLLKLYSATALKWLYEVSLRALAEASPGALPQPESSRRIGAENVPKKAYLISLLLAVFRDQTMGRRFFDSLPPATREVLSAVTWEPQVNLAALEKRLGLQIARANPDTRRSYYEPFLLPPENSLVVVLKTAEDHWSYYSESNKPKKEDYCLLLPDVVRKLFKTLVPPPAGYELVPVEILPTGDRLRYCCAEKVFADLGLVAEYIAQGHLKYTKSERVAMPSLKALRQMTGGPEFFPDSDNPDLGMLRTRLLVGGMAFAGEKERERLLAQGGSAAPVRDLIEKVLANASFLHEELLSHIPLSRNRWCQYNPRSIKNLVSFFGKLPVEKWISWDNMRSYHALREDLPTLFDERTMGLEAYVTTDKNQWSPVVRVSGHNVFELVSEPLLKGYAFLMATFGLTEIAYAAPTHAIYRRTKEAYLTPFDNLAFVRLTPLGEFVFRRRDTYEVTSPVQTRSSLILDQTRLLATCRNADPLTELSLGQFFEELAPGRYRMTPKSLLGGCRSREDIEERIRLFRRVVSATPPPIWEGFFERTLARIAPLNVESDYLVLKVSPDEEIRRLLASDPVLREIVLKVEGLRIAVRQCDLTKLAKRLEQFGYLSPLPKPQRGH